MAPHAGNGLLAVLLLTHSRPGPKLIFHCPAHPKVPDNAHDIDSDLESDDEDGDGDASNRSEDGGEGLLGFSLDSLEKLLAPGRWADGKKFEIWVDGVGFVGCPVLGKEDGEWSGGGGDGGDVDVGGGGEEGSGERSRERDVGEEGQNADNDNLTHDSIADDEGQTDDITRATANITITAPETPAKAQGPAHSFTHMPDSFDSQLGTSFATSFNSASTTSGVVVEQMTMFHVVFVLSPGSRQDEATEVYQQVAKKLSRALHYCQKQSGYVATQSKKLLALQLKARQSKMSDEALWKQMMENSELAWALREIYEKIRAESVASIRLSGMEMSLHIPSNPPPTDDVDLPPHTGLLLLEDKDTLLRTLDPSPLATFIHDHTPTKTLQKLSTATNTSLSATTYLARHLITWRKARPITPLHPRNTYVVAPDAPAERVAQLAPLYARRFAALPPLSQMLRMLSGRPIRYGILIPSREHRGPFMDVLAFLVREGFVVLLRTFGWLRVGGVGAGDEVQRKKRPSSGAGVSLLSAEKANGAEESDAVSMVGSESSAVTTLAATASKEVDQVGKQGQRIILDPNDLTDEDSDALDHLGDLLLPADWELRERFPQLLGHLDGEHAFEEIAGREGWKRARVEEWLAWLESRGLLLTFKSI